MVKEVATRNPSASNKLKTAHCLFCNTEFLRKRLLNPSRSSDKKTGAYVIANDFPFGPYFHYIVMPRDAIHSWEAVKEHHLLEMNLAIREFLDPDTPTGRAHLNGSAGVRIGLNSTMRHLILGKHTRNSAGASIAHVHKQVWGMAPGSVNLADHLSKICRAYFEKQQIDYLASYLTALKRAGLVIWEDTNVALYIPLGQIAT